MKFGLLLLMSFIVANHAFSQVYVIERGLVWNGEEFVQKSIFISDGVFIAQRPASADTIINAHGTYIIPPFGDFHTHVFDSEFAQPVDSIYRSRGIFFAQELVNNPGGRTQNLEYLNRPETVDVAFANGAITSNYGHPIESYERMALGINWPRTQAQRDTIRESRLMEGQTYYIVDDTSDIQPKLNQLASTEPDIAKLIL